MEALTISSFDKEMCRILKGDYLPGYNKNVQERSEAGQFFIVAENNEGRVRKFKFRKEWILNDICITMYDNFDGIFLGSVRVG